MTRVIAADWDVPDHIKAFVTLRDGGVSQGHFNSFNLASHVGDVPKDVQRNRQVLQQELQLPSQPKWLNQTHSTNVIELRHTTEASSELSAPTDVSTDAVWTESLNTVCAVLTADCLPVFLYHQKEQKVAVIHAGWRGLAKGIIEKTIQQMTSRPEQVIAWLGPAIGSDKFQVGEEVRAAFCDNDPQSSQYFSFSKLVAGKQYYLANIYQLAKRRLYNEGVDDCSGGNYCTFSEQRFYSYRRDGETGRMANLIWISDDHSLKQEIWNRN